MLYCICRKWREEKGKVELLDSPEEGRGGLFAKLKPLLICQNCQASNGNSFFFPLSYWIIFRALVKMARCASAKGRGTISALRVAICRKRLLERCFVVVVVVVVVLLLLLFCFGGAHDKNFPSHLTCLSQGCPLCSSPMMGRHSFLEKVVDQQFLYTSLAQWIPHRMKR